MLFNPQSIDRFLQLLRMPQTQDPSSPLKSRLIIAGADHGIASEKISRYQHGNTLSVLKFSASSHSPVSTLASSLGIKTDFLNIGCTRKSINNSISNQFYIGPGTANIAKENAIPEDWLQDVFNLSKIFINEIYEDNICLGEVGIGNTLSTTALTSVITNISSDTLTGLGSGISHDSLILKKELIKNSLQRHRSVYHNNKDPLILLQSLGGLEIAWNTAMIVNAAKKNKTIFLDGYITTVSAALAYLIDTQVKKHLVATHLSREPGHQYLLDFIGLKPFLTLDLALGQGFGAVLGFSFVHTQHNIFKSKLNHEF